MKTDIYRNNTQLEQVHTFIYLGVALNYMCDLGIGIKRRIE